MARHPATLAASLCALAVAFSATASAQAADTRTPEAIAIQTGLERACLPMLEHHGAAPPRPAGFERDENGLFLPIRDAEQLRITPPDAVNPDVCTLRLHYVAGGRQGMLALLDAWSAARHLQPIKVDQRGQGAQDLRWTSTWSGDTSDGRMAIAFSADHPLAGSGPGGLNQATIEISLTPKGS